MTAPTTTSTSPATDVWLADLRVHPDLELFTPDDAGYDTWRTTWNLAVEHHPVAVAVPTSTGGVVAVVEAARRHGVSLAIQSAGHGPARAACDAILLNLARLADVRVDPERRTARIAGGAKWQAVLDVVTPHGLAPLLGSTPDVSAVGYTLGGGLGWLARKYGTSADSVLAFELVTAEGELLRVTPDENAELFWALRGAGAGHLGVVTAMEIRLYPVAEVYGGSLYYPATMAHEVMQRWRDWIPTVPEDLTSAVTLVNFPDLEDVPEELRGAAYVLVRGAFKGPTEDGERLLAHWREWRQPDVDEWGPLPFDRIAEISQDPLEPVPYEGTGLWLGSLGDDTIDALVSGTFPPDRPPLLVQTELRHAGGALARGTSQPAAFGNRDAAILLELVGVTETASDVAAVRSLIHDLTARIAPDLTGGHYLNYVEGGDRRHGVARGTVPGAYERLAALKALLDPDDLFNHGLDVTGHPSRED
ncbi:FAD-binding oxidoreductase [Nocardioides coralli]|uniref:FAD-binding oxidoreductase n=1 Tax=Nocardioides coralli TaxID=2872154 RepID=UPI001CA3E57E|nr:FAD-binding oxidoreductase [Nocardioides coralli]QZY28489.1 FAD-binding oxidoreductase [Nocardioides coralli]